MKTNKKPPKPPKPKTPTDAEVRQLLRQLSGFGFGTGGGTRVVRKPIKEDHQL